MKGCVGVQQKFGLRKEFRYELSVSIDVRGSFSAVLNLPSFKLTAFEFPALIHTATIFQ